MSENFDPNSPNSNLDPQNEMHNLAKVAPVETFEGQWPGDGSGLDDFADFNALEGNDC
jgi:hypothetical protein